MSKKFNENDLVTILEYTRTSNNHKSPHYHEFFGRVVQVVKYEGRNNHNKLVKVNYLNNYDTEKSKLMKKYCYHEDNLIKVTDLGIVDHFLLRYLSPGGEYEVKVSKILPNKEVVTRIDRFIVTKNQIYEKFTQAKLIDYFSNELTVESIRRDHKVVYEYVGFNSFFNYSKLNERFSNPVSQEQYLDVSNIGNVGRDSIMTLNIFD